MREIIMTTATKNRTRRFLNMEETIKEHNIHAKAQKKYVYRVFKVDKFISTNGVKTRKPGHIHIERNFDGDVGIGRTTYRTTGSFYVNRGFNTFAVVFLHSIRFDILPLV